MSALFRYSLLPLIFLQPFLINAQREAVIPIVYTINPEVKAKAEKSLKKDGEILMGQMDIKIFENDSIILNTFDSTRKIPFFIRANIYGNVISINGFAGLFSGFGFVLNIKGDSCQVLFNITTDDPEIYRLDSTDEYKAGLIVPASSSKVLLSEKPDTKILSASHPLAGYIELESWHYFEKSKKSDKKYKVIIKSYFKTGKIE
jgi:hypothetical protein